MIIKAQSACILQLELVSWKWRAVLDLEVQELLLSNSCNCILLDMWVEKLVVLMLAKFWQNC